MIETQTMTGTRERMRIAFATPAMHLRGTPINGAAYRVVGADIGVRDLLAGDSDARSFGALAHGSAVHS